MLGFNAMLLIDRNEQFYCTDSVEEEFMNLPGIQSSFQGENSLSFLNEQSILYSVPVYQDDVVVGVLAGIRDKRNMQNLIQPESFSGLRCV